MLPKLLNLLDWLSSSDLNRFSTLRGAALELADENEKLREELKELRRRIEALEQRPVYVPYIAAPLQPNAPPSWPQPPVVTWCGPNSGGSVPVFAPTCTAPSQPLS